MREYSVRLELDSGQRTRQYFNRYRFDCMWSSCIEMLLTGIKIHYNLAPLYKFTLRFRAKFTKKIDTNPNLRNSSK